MNLRDLAYFETIAETSHLGRAAELLGRTQPALTKCIQRLEGSVGASLFAKDGRGLKLTPVGKVLLERARAMRETAKTYSREVSDFAQGKAGRVRVGTGATTAEYLLPAVGAKLLKQNPGIAVEVAVGLNDMLRAMLRNGQLDVAIGPISSSDKSEFSVLEIGSDDVVVAARRGHPLARGSAKMADFTKYDWVLPAGTVALRQWIDAAFDKASLPRPRVQVETNVLSLLFGLVARTDLVIFTSRHNLALHRGDDTLVEVQNRRTTMARKLGLVFYPAMTDKPAVRTFINVARSVAPGILK